MDPAGPDGSGHGGELSRHSQRSCRNFVFPAHHWGPRHRFAHDGKVSQVCKYFEEVFCFHGHRGDGCSCQYPKLPGPLEWDRRHSEPHVTLPDPHLGLARRGSEPTYLPSVAVAVGWGWARASWSAEPGLEGLARKDEDIGGSSWKSLPSSSADGDHGYSQESLPKFHLVQELTAPLQSLDLEDSQNVVCGICMDKVWDKPEAQRIFGILPNCSHAHCLGCLRTWRKNRQDFPLDVIKACPQCRVHSSYIIPHKFWVSKGAQKEQLIRNFKARTSQILCRFFVRGNGRCPFKSECIYLHQLPAKALTSSSRWPKRVHLASGSEVPGPASFLRGAEPQYNAFFTNSALAVTFWGSELLQDPSSSCYGLL
ncbi:uncharacterized protein LOC144582128 [Callithrix jacchus]